MRIPCQACGKESDLSGRVGFSDICPVCRAWLHACRQCLSWGEGSRGCSEPQAERPRDPEGKNFCEWFRLRTAPRGAGPAPGGKEAAEAAWKRLMGKGKG